MSFLFFNHSFTTSSNEKIIKDEIFKVSFLKTWFRIKMFFFEKRIQLKFDSIIFDLFKIKILLLFIPRFYSTYTSSQCWIWKLKLLFSALFYCPQEWLSDICYAIILIWWSKYFADIWIDIFFIHCEKKMRKYSDCASSTASYFTLKFLTSEA